MTIFRVEAGKDNKFLKQQMRNTIANMRSYSPDNQTRTSPIDLSFVRNAVIENESFLTNHTLLGNRTDDTISQGIIPVLHSIGILNEQIKAYNSSNDSKIKGEIKTMITSHGYVLNSELTAVESTLDEIILKIEKHLSKFN